MMPPLIMPPILEDWTLYFVFGLFGILLIGLLDEAVQFVRKWRRQ